MSVSAPDRSNAGAITLRTSLIVALVAFAPVVAVSAASWRFLQAGGSSFPPSALHQTKAVLNALATPGVRSDSWEPMRQALALLHGPDRDHLYQSLFFDAKVRFQYPPSSLLPFDLLDRFGFASDLALNRLDAFLFLANAFAMALLAWLFTARAASRGPAPGPILAEPALAFAAAFFFYPAVHAVILGQIQVWVDLLVTLACIFWLLERRALAGAAIGLSCAIKPQFALLLPWALLWRDFAFAKGLVLAAASTLALSTALYGFGNHLAYLDVLSFLSKHGESFFANNSVNGIVNRLLHNGDNLDWTPFVFTPFNPLVYAATLAASAAALAAMLAAPILRGGRANIFDFAAACLLAVIGSPVAWEHHYGVALPLYVLLAQALLRRPAGRARAARLAALAISWFPTANWMPFANTLAQSKLNFVQSYCFFGAVILAALLMIEAHDEREPARSAEAAARLPAEAAHVA